MTTPDKSATPGISDGRARYLARRRRRRLIKRSIIGGIAVLAVTAVAIAKPAYLKFREWKFDGLLKEANDAVQKADWNTAFQRSATVLMARKQDFDAAWLMYLSTRELKSPAAVDLGRWLLMQPGVTDEQQVAILQTFADNAPEALFFSGRMRVPEALRETPPVQTIFAKVLIRRGDLAQAEKVLRFAPGLHQYPPALVQLANILSRRGQARDIGEAWQIFRFLKSGGHSTEALEVMRLLSAIGSDEVLKGAEDALALWIEGQPGITTKDVLTGLDVDVIQGRKKLKSVRDALLTDVRLSQGNAQKLKDVAAVGNWLTRRGFPDEAISLLTAPAATDSAAFAALADAYISAAEKDAPVRDSRLSAAAALITAPPPGMNLVELEKVRIRVARARGETSAENAAWESAVKAVRLAPSENQGFGLAEFAAAMKREDQRVNAMSAALGHPRGPLPFYHRAEPILVKLARAHRLPEVLQICRNLSLYEPDNLALRNNLLYLQLLLGDVAAEEAVSQYLDLCRKEPKSIEFALSLSLAFLLAHQPEKAAGVLSPLMAAKDVPQRTLFLGAALRLSGKENEGSALLRGLDWAAPGLLPEEVSVVRALLVPLDEALQKQQADDAKGALRAPQAPPVQAPPATNN